MKHTSLIVPVLLLAATLGCENRSASPAPGAVGIVELDKVAQAMGWLTRMQERLGSQTQNFDVQLSGLKTQIETTINAERRKIGEHPTPQQQQQLAQMIAVGNNQLATAANQAQNQVATLRAQMATQYRDLVCPVARRVADAHGLSIVLAADAGQVLSYNDSVNLTQAVIDALQKNPPPDPFAAPASQPAAAPNTAPAK